jgi:hypothetical protein
MKKSTFKKGVAVILTLFVTQCIVAQKNLTLYQMESLPQSHYMNAAFKPNAKLYVTLPPIGLGMQNIGISHSGFTFNDLFQTRSYDDSLELRPDLAVNAMAKLNHVNVEMTNEILGFGFRLKKNFISFSVAAKTQFNFAYPKDLMQFVLEGNGKNFIGERASFDGLGLNFSSYMEYALGFNREITNKLTVGGRVKYISGLANIRTVKSELGIYTEENEFDLTLDGSMRLNTSNFNQFFSGDDVSPKNVISSLYNFNNFGLGFDFGGTYDITDKITVSASVNDLGFIRWKSDVKNFVLEDVDYTFEGIDFKRMLNDSVNVFQELGDSLGSLFQATENTDSYSTALYTRFYLGGSYQLTKILRLNGMMYNEVINNRYRAGLTLGVNADLGHWFSASLNYSAYGRSFSNVGLGFSIRGGGVQYYLATDNVLGIIMPQASKNFHIMTGINIMIGKPDKKVKTTARLVEETE